MHVDLSESECDRIISELDSLLRQVGENDPAKPGLSAETGEAIHKIWFALTGKAHPRMIAVRASRRRLFEMPVRDIQTESNGQWIF
jgi:hypothetical protein